VPEAYRFDIDAIREQLVTAQPLLRTRWLQESYANPEGFLSALCDYHAALLTPAAKSNLSSGFDFYYDAVLRHASSVSAERVALRGFDERRGLFSLTYGALHNRASSLTEVLREQGVKPKAVLCCLLPFGEGFLICLAAALRIGATVSFVPPLGERYVARRLKALKPAYVLTERLYEPLCLGHKPLFVSESSGTPSYDARSFTYAPAAPALLLVSPLREPPDSVTPVTSAVAYLRALRDGLCVYGLRAGDGLAAPGFDVVQHQPALLLATLLCGATFVDLEPDALARDPTLLVRLGVTCLGINNATRDALRKAPQTSLPRLRSWFRPVLEPLDSEAWRELLARHGLGAVPNLNVHIDAAQGGVQLFSSRNKSKITVSNFVLPALGVPYSLATPELSGQKSLARSGVYMSVGQKKGSGYLILARAGEEYFLIGTLTPRCAGQVFPAAEVQAVVCELPWVVGAATVTIAQAGEVNRFAFVLLVFLGSREVKNAANVCAQIEQHISFLLSPQHVPSYIELYSLYPRMKEGVVDESWCQTQYVSGSLHRKSQSRSAKLLTELRKVCAAKK
jgi:hypothetical protein